MLQYRYTNLAFSTPGLGTRLGLEGMSRQKCILEFLILVVFHYIYCFARINPMRGYPSLQQER